MRLRTRTFCMVLAMLAMAMCQSASADPVISFSIDDGATFGSAFNVASASSTLVSVYLRDDGSDILLDEALAGYGLRGDMTSSRGAISSAGVDSVFDIKVQDTFTGNSLNWEALVLFGTPPVGPDVLLGTFQFDATADGASEFRFSDINIADTNWSTAIIPPTALDERIFGTGSTGTYSLRLIAGVPEPSSLGLLGLIGGIVTLRRKRRMLK